jgi:hypothetical protein
VIPHGDRRDGTQSRRIEGEKVASAKGISDALHEIGQDSANTGDGD